MKLNNFIVINWEYGDPLTLTVYDTFDGSRISQNVSCIVQEVNGKKL